MLSVPQSSVVQQLQAIQGFDRTMPIFDQTLSVDRSLFQDLEVALQHTNTVQSQGHNIPKLPFIHKLSKDKKGYIK